VTAGRCGRSTATSRRERRLEMWSSASIPERLEVLGRSLANVLMVINTCLVEERPCNTAGMPAISAGILLYRRVAAPEGNGAVALEVLLVHPGGPYWARKDAGAWSIPKGEAEADELGSAPAPTEPWRRPAKVKPRLRAAAAELRQLPQWEPAAIEAAVRELPTKLAAKPKPVFAALRLGMSGQSVTPGLFESLHVLGREEAVVRLELAAALLD